MFKGGTSLSKVYGLIDRFSEDVDLILDWRLLGYGSKEEDPTRARLSKTQQDRLNKQINTKAAAYIGGPLLAQLRTLLSSVSELSVTVDARDPHCIDVQYPAIFSAAYLLPQVRLEIGPLASWVPSSRRSIQSYASEDYPEAFQDPACPVIAIAAERTFWEKVTILHKEAHRGGPMPARYSRHYYDLYKLASAPIKKSALIDLDLLRADVEFKERFYPSAWARYDLAKPGTFKVIPSVAHLAELEKDFKAMESMIFGEIPPFERIIDTLQVLEKEING